MATLKRLKRGDENELERNLKEWRRWSLANSSGDRRRKKSRLENDTDNKRLRLVIEIDKERKARLEKMVATHSSC